MKTAILQTQTMCKVTPSGTFLIPRLHLLDSSSNIFLRGKSFGTYATSAHDLARGHMRYPPVQRKSRAGFAGFPKISKLCACYGSLSLPSARNSPFHRIRHHSRFAYSEHTFLSAMLVFTHHLASFDAFKEVPCYLIPRFQRMSAATSCYTAIGAAPLQISPFQVSSPCLQFASGLT